MNGLRLTNVPDVAMNGSIATITPPTPSTIGHKRRRSSSVRSSATLDVDSDADSGSKAFAALDRLIELSPEENDVPIPMVAVVGGQSVGKSSLYPYGAPSARRHCERVWRALWRADGSGPTHIHSRRRPGGEFAAIVYIKLAEPAGGTNTSFLFTKVPLATKDKLGTVLQMAGNEARRVGDGKGVVMRTYEELCLLREGGLAARIEDSTGWPALTNNIVQLMVAGPNQPDISIVDLPGLVSGDGAIISRRLAEKYLAKLGNLILLCLPAGGADPTTDSPETSLVLKHDKELKRTMIVVTKPDHIGDPTRSAWGDLIANQNKGFKYHAALGVHPVRARTCCEYDEGMSTEEIIATGDDLFSGPKWIALAETCGREFGWRATSNAIYSKYEKLVKENIPKLEQRIRDNIKAVQLEESKLPPKVEQPVEKLHRVIAAIEREVTHRIGGSHDLGKPFHERTRRFRKDLVDTIPTFVPVCKDDEHRLVGDGEEPEFPRWYQRSNDVPANKIFLDDLQTKLHEHPRAHNGVLPHEARARLVKEYVAPWRGLCEEFNNDAWKILDGLVDAAVRSACVDMPEAAELVVNALTALREPQQQRVHAFISERIDAELAKVVSYNDDKIREISAVYNHRMSVLQTAYKSTWDDAFSFFEPAMPAADSPPAQWPREYANLIIRFAVTADWHIHESGRRITEDMELALPEAILGGFLPQVSTQLRERFGLLNVRDSVAKRAARLCEPNEDIVEQRAALAKRRKTLEELQTVLAPHTLK